MVLDTRERQYISLNSTDTLGLAINVAGVLADPDNSTVTATLLDESTNAVIFQSRPTVRQGTGLYEVTLSGQDTANSGPATLTFNYSVNGVADGYSIYLTIGDASPDYDALPPDMKAIVDLTWVRFADLFDSPGGGPNLQTYFQTHWSRNRVAQLLRLALGTLNTAAQPFQTYTLNGTGGSEFPVAQWGPLLERQLYVECLKHLMRSYVEQVQFMGGTVTRVDRRDYLDRWRSILLDEQDTLRSEMDVFKIRMMGLGRPKVLVSGGVYGRFAPTRMAGSVAARPRYWSRFY